MDFPLIDLMDEAACSERLVALLHPDGLACPRCGAREGLGIHRRHRGALIDDQCGGCGRVFNAFAGTPLRGTRRTPAQLLLILRGIAQAAPTARMARAGVRPQAPPGAPAPPPGQRPTRAGPQPAGRRRGRGGRGLRQRGGKKGSRIPTRATRRGGGPTAAAATGPSPTTGRRWPGSSGGAPVRCAWRSSSRPAGRSWRTWSTTRAWRARRSTPTSGRGYNGLPRIERGHVTVDHSGPKSTWARDDDGDGIREVHCNTMEGPWTGLRNFLRPFRGVSKWYLAQYEAIFQWGHNIKRVTDEFLRTTLGIRPSTVSAS